MLEPLLEWAARTWLERKSLRTVVLMLFALFALALAIVPAVLLVGFFAR
ncbi:MAG TPA: hypothetical protein VJ724_13620 [Tahibacter sp.]|nr:hypothetical protein [Tahibacter sp.]